MKGSLFNALLVAAPALLNAQTPLALRATPVHDDLLAEILNDAEMQDLNKLGSAKKERCGFASLLDRPLRYLRRGDRVGLQLSLRAGRLRIRRDTHTRGLRPRRSGATRCDSMVATHDPRPCGARA